MSILVQALSGRMHRLIGTLIGMATSEATEATQPSAGAMAEAGFQSQRDAIKKLLQDTKDTDQFAGNISRTVVLNSYFYYRGVTHVPLPLPAAAAAVRTYVRTYVFLVWGGYVPPCSTYVLGRVRTPPIVPRRAGPGNPPVEVRTYALVRTYVRTLGGTPQDQLRTYVAATWPPHSYVHFAHGEIWSCTILEIRTYVRTYVRMCFGCALRFSCVFLKQAWA